MRHRRTKWLAVTWIFVAALGYAVGRQHQRATIAAYHDLAVTIREMVESYEAANTIMWDALGVMARPTDPTDR